MAFFRNFISLFNLLSKVIIVFVLIAFLVLFPLDSFLLSFIFIKFLINFYSCMFWFVNFDFFESLIVLLITNRIISFSMFSQSKRRTYLEFHITKYTVIKRSMILSKIGRGASSTYTRMVTDPMTSHVRDYSYLTGKLKTPYYKKPGHWVVHVGVANEGLHVIVDSQNPEIWTNPIDNLEYQRVVILTKQPTTIDQNGNVLQNFKIADKGIYGQPLSQYANVYWILKSEVIPALAKNAVNIDIYVVAQAIGLLKTHHISDHIKNITTIK